MQRDAHADPISLGFPVKIENDYLYSLRSQYLPLGKIGGKPSWLNPKHIPTSQQLECKVCTKAMCFLIQLYATSNDDPPHSFHRTIYIFICRNPECSKANDASNFAAFRCILPRANEYYSFDGPMDPDLDGDVPDPHLPKDAPHLCELCGCFASKKCAKCGDAWYCCRDHQALDWTTSHKVACGKPKVVEDEAKNPSNLFLFKEHGICLDNEYIPANLLEGISDDEDADGVDSDDESEADRAERMKDFEKFVDSQKGKNEDITTEDVEAAVTEQKKDELFEKFNRFINLNPDQIVRYQRYGEPLPASDRATALPEPDAVPSCDVCGSARRFEFQLTPHLLSLMEVDRVGQSIDFAGVYIYACMRSCEIPNQGYAQEFVVKQDFV